MTVKTSLAKVFVLSASLMSYEAIAQSRSPTDDLGIHFGNFFLGQSYRRCAIIPTENWTRELPDWQNDCPRRYTATGKFLIEKYLGVYDDPDAGKRSDRMPDKNIFAFRG